MATEGRMAPHRGDSNVGLASILWNKPSFFGKLHLFPPLWRIQLFDLAEISSYSRCPSVDGTLIQAWASQKNFRRKDSADDSDGDGSTGHNAERNFRGEKRSSDTHHFTTASDARFARKSRRSRANA